MAVSWQWIFAIIGVGAFLMAIQPFTQVIWGRPKIEVDFSARDSGNSRFLDILIFNRPIQNWFLKTIKVRRDKAEDVFVKCCIKNIQTGQVYTEKMFPKIYNLSAEGYSISLPGTTTQHQFYW